MLNLDSKTGIAGGSQEKVFNYITDFRNFAHLLPEERLTDVKISKEEIEFNLAGLGKVGLRIHALTPYTKVIIKSTEESATGFTFVIYLDQAGEQQTGVKMQLEANLNMFLEMMARGPLQQFLDLMVDKLVAVDFTGQDQ
jgi:carbon monoxide dehydrogenase subunit G